MDKSISAKDNGIEQPKERVREDVGYRDAPILKIHSRIIWHTLYLPNGILKVLIGEEDVDSRPHALDAHHAVPLSEKWIFLEETLSVRN